ncbi:MAG: hypothetical protein ACRDHM_07900 [Actinomycetota bacterium]
MSQLPEVKGPDRQVRYGRILGLVFLLAGFLAIGLGWNGMAQKACPDCQLPYLLSGGAAGLGLILLGATLVLAAQFRDERLKLAETLKAVGTAVSKAVTSGGAAAPGELVVAGKSTYHRPGCRLVEGKTDVDFVSVEVARLNGLSPCRVCSPPTGEDGADKKQAAKTPSRKKTAVRR